MSILLILNSLLVTVSYGDSERGESCPTWTYPNTSDLHYKCVCGASITQIINCNSETLTVQIKENSCVFFSNIWNSTLIGSCPYGSGGILPKNVSTIKQDGALCSSRLHRKGQLCGECENNYSLPVYSYSSGCVKCHPKDFKYSWIKFITIAFLPLTIFYILVIIFRISVNSSALNGYILVSQLAVIPPMICYFYNRNQVNPYFHVTYLTQFIVDLGIAIYAIWNLDFFRSFYKSICLLPNLTYPQVVLFDYAIAVYPLLLIFITFVLVKLHDNSMLVVKIWRPFSRCFALFRKHWNIHRSLVDALATFIVLSYIKILNVSFELLLPSHVYNEKGQDVTVKIALLYYDGSVDMTSRAYLPYLMLALIMLFIFNMFPLVLLTVYPFQCFQVLLSKCFSQKYRLALKIFMDAFHGCYENTPRDCRQFATLYLALRFFNLLMYSVFYEKVYFPTASLLLVFVLALVAKFQPYKERRNNTVDMVMIVALISGHASLLFHHIDLYPGYPKWVNGVIVGIAALIPPSYIVFLFLAHISTKFTASKMLGECIDRIRIKCRLKEQALSTYTEVYT